MNTVGCELLNFIDPDLTWKNVAKGSRSNLRRKPAGGSFTMLPRKDFDPITVSDTEKNGVDILGHHFSDKLQHVPIKKRRLQVCSSALLKQSSSAQTANDPRRQRKCSNASNGSGLRIGSKLDCTDFSGIEILAAVACNIEFGGEKCPLIVVAEKEDKEVGDVSRVHWDLNVAMDAWKQCVYAKEDSDHLKMESAPRNDETKPLRLEEEGSANERNDEKLSIDCGTGEADAATNEEASPEEVIPKDAESKNSELEKIGAVCEEERAGYESQFEDGELRDCAEFACEDEEEKPCCVTVIRENRRSTKQDDFITPKTRNSDAFSYRSGRFSPVRREERLFRSRPEKVTSQKFISGETRPRGRHFSTFWDSERRSSDNPRDRKPQAHRDEVYGDRRFDRSLSPTRSIRRGILNNHLPRSSPSFHDPRFRSWSDFLPNERQVPYRYHSYDPDRSIRKSLPARDREDFLEYKTPKMGGDHRGARSGVKRTRFSLDDDWRLDSGSPSRRGNFGCVREYVGDRRDGGRGYETDRYGFAVEKPHRERTTSRRCHDDYGVG